MMLSTRVDSGISIAYKKTKGNSCGMIYAHPFLINQIYIHYHYWPFWQHYCRLLDEVNDQTLTWLSNFNI